MEKMKRPSRHELKQLLHEEEVKEWRKIQADLLEEKVPDEKPKTKLPFEDDPYISRLRKAEKITGRKFVTQAIIKEYVRDNPHVWHPKAKEGEEGEIFRDVEYTKLQMQRNGMMAGLMYIFSITALLGIVYVFG